MAPSASCRVQTSSGELRELGKVTVSSTFTLREKSGGISSIHLDYSLVWENLGWVTVYLLHRRVTCAVPWFLRRALRHSKTSLYGFRIASQSQYVILFPCLSYACASEHIHCPGWCQLNAEVSRQKKGSSASHTFYYSSGYQDWTRQQSQRAISRTRFPARSEWLDLEMERSVCVFID